MVPLLIFCSHASRMVESAGSVNHTILEPSFSDFPTSDEVTNQFDQRPNYVLSSGSYIYKANADSCDDS